MTNHPPFSVEEFLTFCRSKPADEEYDYCDTHNCALCQFGEEVLGFQDSRAGGDYVYDYDLYDDTVVASPPEVSNAAVDKPWTFGALATRLEAVLAEKVL